MRKKLRVLVNSDIDTPEFIKFVNSEKFEVDDRSLSTIGNDDSADILSEYDAIILNYSKPTIINPIRYRQLIKFLNDSEKTLVLLMRKHSENQHQSTTQIIGGILEHLQIKTEKIDIRNKGENHENPTEIWRHRRAVYGNQPPDRPYHLRRGIGLYQHH